MATSKKFSELPVASSMNNGDLFAVAQEDAQAETGYTSKNVTALVVGKKLNGEIEYATDLPSFPPGDQNPLDALEYLNSKINDLYPVDSASGSLVNFTTSLALPLVALKTAITVQGGGGTPSAPVAIVGVNEVNLTRAGKNLFNPVDITIGTIENNKWVITGSGGSRKAIDFIFKPNTQYTFSGHEVQTVANKNSRLRVVYTDDTVVNIWTDNTTDGLDFSYTSNASKSIKEVVFDYSSASGSVEISNLQLEFGSTATAYEEYNGDTFTLNLGQTIYGGYVDWNEGKLVIDKAFAEFDGSEAGWTNYSAGNGYYITISDMEIGNNLPSKSNYLPQYSGVNELGLRYGFNNNVAYCYQTNTLDGVTDVASWKTYLSNNHLQVVYPLATPIEVDLPTTMPSTIEGVQNWFADSGDIELEYKMGVQEYIDKKIAEVQALIL